MTLSYPSQILPREQRQVSILGTRGIPAKHGGFETLIQHLAPWLARRGWDVTVYCQDESRNGPHKWNGVRLVQIPVRWRNSRGSVEFDWQSVRQAARTAPLVLTLGYNTATFGLYYHWQKVINVVNMDGLEWQRKKWPLPIRCWFWLNERAAIRLANHMIADHPEIARRLRRFAPESRITMIPYGANRIDRADRELLAPYGLEPSGYALSIARIERENQTLEIVRAFSRRPRGIVLAVLGNLDPAASRYHAEVMAAAGPEVRFLGPVYDPTTVSALRFYARLYLHGHQVGGTNPSLVEALGAGAPILAHDNRFNRWVAGKGQEYFGSETELATCLDRLLEDRERLRVMSATSRKRHAEAFTWDPVLTAYEDLLMQMAART